MFLLLGQNGNSNDKIFRNNHLSFRGIGETMFLVTFKQTQKVGQNLFLYWSIYLYAEQHRLR